MLNSYSVTPKVDARTTLDFNAVSGTIFKSHPKSIFVWFQYGSETQKNLMGANPLYNFDNQYLNSKEPTILLQMMLTGENRVIAEIIKETDFEEKIDD